MNLLTWFVCAHNTCAALQAQLKVIQAGQA
jgi:hypothetical protein